MNDGESARKRRKASRRIDEGSTRKAKEPQRRRRGMPETKPTGGIAPPVGEAMRDSATEEVIPLAAQDVRRNPAEAVIPLAEEEMRPDPIEAVIPLAEEEARVGKRRVVTGRVRIRTLVEEVEEIARTALEEEIVDIERVPVDRPVEAAPAIRTEGEVTIVPVVEEVLVIEKRLVLKEELHIRRRRRSETVAVPVTVRKQRAVVERLPAKRPEGSEEDR